VLEFASNEGRWSNSDEWFSQEGARDLDASRCVSEGDPCIGQRLDPLKTDPAFGAKLDFPRSPRPGRSQPHELNHHHESKLLGLAPAAFKSSVVRMPQPYLSVLEVEPQASVACECRTETNRRMQSLV